MVHASERLYADASVRSERIAAHKSAYLAEAGGGVVFSRKRGARIVASQERRRWSAEGAKARKHSRRPVSPKHKKKCAVARTLDLDKFSDAFSETASAIDALDVDGVEPEARPGATPRRRATGAVRRSGGRRRARSRRPPATAQGTRRTSGTTASSRARRRPPPVAGRFVVHRDRRTRDDFDAWAAHQRRRFLHLMDAQKPEEAKHRALHRSPEKQRDELVALEENWV